MNKALIAIMCLTISACSSTPTQFWFESTESLIENHEYLRALEQAKLTQPTDASLIKQIESKANIYRKKQLKRVQTLFIQKQWAQAQSLLIELTATQPDHIQFKKAKKQLELLRNQEKLKVDADVYLAKAELLDQRISQTNFNQRNEKLAFSWWRTADPFMHEKALLTKKLIALSKQAVSQEEYNLAQKTFEKALKLNEDLRDQPIRQIIYQGLKHQNEVSNSQRQSRLTSQLKAAIKDENFEQIQRYSAVLSKPPFAGQQVAGILNEANKILTDNAVELERLGDSVYRQGNIDSAIELWQQAQALLPSLANLQDKLSRALKVQSKLEKLRQSQKE